MQKTLHMFQGYHSLPQQAKVVLCHRVLNNASVKKLVVKVQSPSIFVIGLDDEDQVVDHVQIELGESAATRFRNLMTQQLGWRGCHQRGNVKYHF